MATDSAELLRNNWRLGLPAPMTRLVLLREPTPADLGPVVDLLSTADASRFGIDDPALWSVLKDDWGSHWVSTASRVH